MRKIVCLLLCYIIINPIYGQRLGIDLLENNDRIEIPFQYKAGFIILTLKFNNVPLNLIFDTGAENTIIFYKEICDLLNMEYSNRVKIIGSDLSYHQYALVARNVVVSLPSLPSVHRDILVLEEYNMNLTESFGVRFDGILGGSFFRGLVIKIDYQKKVLVFYDPNKFEENKGSKTHKLPIKIIRNKPYLEAKISLDNGNIITSNLLLDTGAALPFLLHTNTDSLFSLPENVIAGNLGQGLGGQLKGHLGKVKSLEFGDFTFNQILTSFQNVDSLYLEKSLLVRNGIIGNKLLDRFTVTIDYLRGFLYLKPRKNFDRQFEYDKSGLIIYATGPNFHQFYVKDIQKGSPADLVGILPGDKITRIGFWWAKFWYLDSINKLLSGQDGKKIKMTIFRDGVKIKKQFFLKDLLRNRKQKKE